MIIPEPTRVRQARISRTLRVVRSTRSIERKPSVGYRRINVSGATRGSIFAVLVVAIGYMSSGRGNGGLHAEVVTHDIANDNIESIASIVGVTEDMHSYTWIDSREEWLNPNGAAVAWSRRLDSIHGIPVWLTLAQGIQESGGGTSVIARDNHNYFGHKPHRGKHGDDRGMILYDPAVHHGHQSYQSPFWSFHHHGKMLEHRYIGKRRGDSVKDVVDCLCQKANWGEGYNYAEACAGKDKRGKYGYREWHIVDGKRIPGYEHKLMQVIDSHKLLGYSNSHDHRRTHRAR